MMNIPQKIACHAVVGAAKGVVIYALIILFDVGGVRGMLLSVHETYVAYSVGATGLASLAAMVEIILFVCSAASDELED